MQPDLVIYMRRATGDPKLGLIVSRSVGSAVQRHGLSRRLRHVARDVLADLNRSEHIVIRALPSSRDATSARLGEQLRAGSATYRGGRIQAVNAMTSRLRGVESAVAGA